MKEHYNIGEITAEDKEEIFKGMPKELKYAVLYDKMYHDCGERITTRYGFPTMEKYDNGEVAFQEMGFYATMKEASERCSILPKITNKKYRNAFIVTR